MSRFDRVDVSVLGKCCVTLVQQRVALAAVRERLSCPTCNAKLEHQSGRWRLAQDEFAVELGETSS